MSGPRFIFYSHDGFGLGHIRRNLALSVALADLCPQAGVLLACGAEGVESFAVPRGVDLLRLPGLRKLGNDRYVPRRLPLEASELVSLRAGLLASAVEHFRPDVLLADKHPIGVDGELLTALRLLRREGGRAALGLRDVLDDPEETAGDWRNAGLGDRVAEFHHLVLVYGAPEILSPLSPGLLPLPVTGRVRFCGYVVGSVPGPAPPDLPNGDRRPLVLATVGGGEDGLPLLEAFVEACRGAPWRGAVVGGPQMEASQWARLQARSDEAGLFSYRAVRHLDGWFPEVDALVCMGGYNTLLEAVSCGTPTVCVPRTRPRREQLIRAQAFAAKGLLHLVEPESLTGRGLARAVGTVLETPRRVIAERARAVLDLGGAQRAAALLLELAQDARRPALRPVEVGAG